MKARDLRDRSTEDLVELERSLTGERVSKQVQELHESSRRHQRHPQTKARSGAREAHPRRAHARHHRHQQTARRSSHEAEAACAQARARSEGRRRGDETSKPRRCDGSGQRRRPPRPRQQPRPRKRRRGEEQSPAAASRRPRSRRHRKRPNSHGRRSRPSKGFRAGGPAKAASPKPTSCKAAPAAASGTRPRPCGSAGEHKTHSFRRRLLGKVVSDKMDKTVVVEVVRRSRDTVYKKYVRNREPLQGARREERVQGRRPRRDHGASPDLARQALEGRQASSTRAVEE